jgi:ATP synthase protein I
MNETDAWRRLWWGSAIPTLLAGVVAVAVAGWLRGLDGVIGAVLGVSLVIGFFGLSLLVMKWTAHSDPMNALGGALLSYVVKIVALALILVVFRDTTLFDVQAFGITTLACAVVWLIAEMRAFLSAQFALVSSPEHGPAAGSDEDGQARL